MIRTKGGGEFVSPPPHISTRVQFIKDYQSRGHKIDRKLLNECAYYPKEGCQYCRWDWPFPKCQVAHILVDTRCAGVVGWKSTWRREKVGGKRKENPWKLLGKLPKELQEELMKLLEECE